MSDLGGSSFDPDLSSLVSLAEQSYQDLEEMASGIGSLSEEALATEAANLDPPCCQRVDGTSRGFTPSIELSSGKLASHGTAPGRSISGTSSHVPTVFGGPGSVAAVEDPVVGTSAAPKPGNFSQDHMQCCTNLGGG